MKKKVNILINIGEPLKKTFFRNCINLFIHMHIKTFLKEIYYASIGKVFKEHYFVKYKHTEDLISKTKRAKVYVLWWVLWL